MRFRERGCVACYSRELMTLNSGDTSGGGFEDVGFVV